MSKKRNGVVCCFPVEIKTRGLDPRLYLGLQLIKEGYDVLIGEQNKVKDALYSLNAPFIYFSKGDVPREQFLFSHIKKVGGVFVYLDEEGGIYKKNWDVFVWRADDEILKHVDLYFAWGEALKKVILEFKTKITADKIVVTGHPRFDLRKPQFNSFYAGLTTHKNIPKEYILFNASFGLANEFVTKEFDYNQLLQYRKHKFGKYFDLLDFKKSYHYQKLNLIYWIEAIEYLANQFPELTIVIRPHPSENSDIYFDELKEYKNIIISKEGSVHEWMTNAKLIIHHDCTTAVEALFNEKPFVSFSPVYRKDVTTIVPIGISKRIKEKEELAIIIREHLNLSESPKSSHKISIEQEQFIKPFIANTDFDSSQKIVNEIISRFSSIKQDIPLYDSNELFLPTKKPKEKKSKKAFSMYQQLRTIKKLLVELITGENKAKRNLISARTIEKFPSLSEEELQHRIELFSMIESDIPEVDIHFIKNDLFLIKKKALDI